MICFEPMRLLPPSKRDKWHRYWKFDYFNTVAAAAELMRWRQRELDRYLDRLSKADPSVTNIDEEWFKRCVTTIELHVDRGLEDVIDLEFLHDGIQEDLAEIGDWMQKLMPPGNIEGLHLAFMHRRGMWFSGVVK